MRFQEQLRLAQSVVERESENDSKLNYGNEGNWAVESRFDLIAIFKKICKIYRTFSLKSLKN